MSRANLTRTLAALVAEHGLDAVLVEIATAFEGAADVHEVEDLVGPDVARLRHAVRRMGSAFDAADALTVHADVTADASEAP